jgi:hypothetical protein
VAEAAVERRHLITAVEGGFHDGAPYVVGAAEHEQFHGASLVETDGSCSPTRLPGTPSVGLAEPMSSMYRIFRNF